MLLKSVLYTTTLKVFPGQSLIHVVHALFIFVFIRCWYPLKNIIRGPRYDFWENVMIVQKIILRETWNKCWQKFWKSDKKNIIVILRKFSKLRKRIFKEIVRKCRKNFLLKKFGKNFLLKKFGKNLKNVLDIIRILEEILKKFPVIFRNISKNLLSFWEILKK